MAEDTLFKKYFTLGIMPWGGRITINMLAKKFGLFGSRESEVFIFCERGTSE